MRRIVLPGTELTVSRLGLGTALLHHAMWVSDRLELLHAAVDAGFTHFDTARMYGEGMAERTIGQFLAGGLRQRITLASKIGLPASPLFERMPSLMYAHRVANRLFRRASLQVGESRARALSLKQVTASLDKSLKALNTDWLDILFVHEPQPNDVPALLGLADWIQQLKSSGRVRYLGLSGSAEHCTTIAHQLPGVFEVLQVEDSLSGREADLVSAQGWPLQVTFGYLRRASEQGSIAEEKLDALTVMQEALGRNREGMILASSRNADHLRSLAALVE